GIRSFHVTGVQTCALPIFPPMRLAWTPLVALLTLALPLQGLAEEIPREVAIAFEKAGRRPPLGDPALDRAAELLAVAVLLEGAHAVGSSRRVATELSQIGRA